MDDWYELLKRPLLGCGNVGEADGEGEWGFVRVPAGDPGL